MFLTLYLPWAWPTWVWEKIQYLFSETRGSNKGTDVDKLFSESRHTYLHLYVRLFLYVSSWCVTVEGFSSSSSRQYLPAGLQVATCLSRSGSQTQRNVRISQKACQNTNYLAYSQNFSFTRCGLRPKNFHFAQVSGQHFENQPSKKKGTLTALVSISEEFFYQGSV